MQNTSEHHFSQNVLAKSQAGGTYIGGANKKGFFADYCYFKLKIQVSNPSIHFAHPVINNNHHYVVKDYRNFKIQKYLVLDGTPEVVC